VTLIRPEDVERVVEPENAVVMRALVPTNATEGDLSVTWIELAGRHRRLKTLRSTRVYYVLDGEAEFVVGDGDPFVAGKGDAVVVPRGTPYAFEGEMTYLVINGPGFVHGDDLYEE
jgi:mannose-6-phosphate isomerase-like protein (cupin superfamily)